MILSSEIIFLYIGKYSGLQKKMINNLLYVCMYGVTGTYISHLKAILYITNCYFYFENQKLFNKHNQN